MKKARKKRIVRRKRRISEREIMRIKRKLKKSARKLRLGAKRTGAYVYGTLRRIVGNPKRYTLDADMRKHYSFAEAKRLADERVRRFGMRGIARGVSIQEYKRPEMIRVGGFMVKRGSNLHKQALARERARRAFLAGYERELRGNPATKGRPIPGKFYRVYWSHPSRGETGQITFTGDQLLKIKNITELSRYWPIKEGLKMAKVHFRGPYDSWDDAFMNR